MVQPPPQLQPEISTIPVVINEVAWSGNSAAYYDDEWMELYNRTGKSINLTNWILYSATDLKPYITLSGAVPARGYYLVERTSNETVSDIAADWTGSFGNGGLVNSGENLILSVRLPPLTKSRTATIGVAVHLAIIQWKDMNRIPSEQRFQLGTNNAIIRNGRNAGGGSINGTPKARNSANYLINKGNSVSSNLTLYASGSPYLVDYSIQTFNASSTLTIEAGRGDKI